MQIVQKSSARFLFILILLSLIGCASEVENSSKAMPLTVNGAGWEFIIEEFHIDESLKDISTTVAYGGASKSEEVSQEPSPGKVFLLIKMIIEKQEGSETIDWKKMSLVDSSGNTYHRLHDSFLESFGFKRMKGTTLSFGKNQGWIAFEVDQASKDFKLQYESSEGKIILDLVK